MTDDVLVGGLPDVKAIMAERYQKERLAALERAMKTNLQVYPILGAKWEGCFAVPSQSELGHVHITRLNMRTGEPLPLDGPKPCTCENPKVWCTHIAAAVLWWDRQREIDDNLRAQEAAHNIIRLKEEHFEHANND